MKGTTLVWMNSSTPSEKRCMETVCKKICYRITCMCVCHNKFRIRLLKIGGDTLSGNGQKLLKISFSSMKMWSLILLDSQRRLSSRNAVLSFYHLHPYLSYLASCYFCLVPTLKRELRGQKFKSDKEATNACMFIF